ncbi:MAG: radical SAM protein [Bacteroidota bacterium]
MKKKLLLVNPVDRSRPGIQMNSKAKYPPTAFGIISKLTPENWEVEIIDENIYTFEYREADLVGFTTFTTSAPRAYMLSDLYRSRGIPTVMGGVHASIMVDEALQHTDAVVIGDAENVWPMIIKDAENKCLKKTYHQPLETLENLPVADHAIFDRRYMFGSIQASRGCPMKCMYCVTPAIYNGRYLRRPVEEIINEIENHPRQHLIFVDDNLLGYTDESRRHALELVKSMAERKLNKLWWGHIPINVADNEEFLKYASESGCKMLFIGIEAENEEALREMGKKINLKYNAEKYEKAFATIHKHNIAVMGGFMYGFDSDTRETMDERTRFLKKCSIDAVQVVSLMPYPGTQLNRNLAAEGRITHTNYPDDWVVYDGMTVVYKPKNISQQDFEIYMRKTFKRVFNKTALYKRYMRSRRKIGSKETALWGYTSGQHYRNFMKRYFL